MKLTLRLGYKNQLVNAVQGNNRCLFSDPHKTHNHYLWAERKIAECENGGTCRNQWCTKDGFLVAQTSNSLQLRAIDDLWPRSPSLID
jgi:hypothetical protein